MFFTFHQNNSGGNFVIDRLVAPYVIIEADNADEANIIAEEIGIYFNGAGDFGPDCPCCGDRWYPAEGEGTELPEVHGEPYYKASRVCVGRGETIVRIYYADGTTEVYPK